jgi:glycosyltransferase involved in cell wall biosynthesis
MARICIVYDCLYPWTVGGAERWLTALARFVAEQGHDVTYATRTQWSADAPPEIPGVRVVGVSPNDELYRSDGSRTLREPLRFGRGVGRYLRAHRDEFDLVHTHAFPFFGALAVDRALRGTSIPIVVDWIELWTRDYWLDYAGAAAGRVGNHLQQRTARIPQHALIPSDLHRRRLVEAGVNGDVTILSGLYDGVIEPVARPWQSPPTVVYAGRHIPEKQVEAIPAAIAEARRTIPDLRATIFGDGPTRPAVLAEIGRLGLSDVIATPGFVEPDAIDQAIGSAACLLQPSTREGYGLVVVEASAKGTPSVVVAAPDNAAVELIDSGMNGFIAPTANSTDLAAAIVQCVESGDALRDRTSAWANARGEGLTVRGSMRQVLKVYDRVLAEQRPSATSSSG